MDSNEEAVARIEISNLGGIDHLETTIPAGLTILSGENATNRTSFLRSIAAALGADDSAATLKSDAEEGSVELEMDAMSATREYSSTNGTVVRDGSPIAEDPDLVDTYASIFATNPARSVIRNGGDGLRDVLMRGVDTEAINERVRSLKRERSSLEQQLAEIETIKSDLPGLRERENSLESDLDSVEDRIETVEAEIEAYEATNEEIREAERHLEDLEDLRGQLRRIQDEIAETENTIAAYEGEKEDIESTLDELSVPEERRDGLSERKRSLENDISERRKTITELNDIISNNRSILEGDDVLDEFGVGNDVTSQLNPETATVQCWTCGNEVDRSRIRTRIETLEKIRMEKNEELQELREEHTEVRSKIADIETEEDQRRRYQTELQETERTIQSERATLEDLRSEAESLRDEIEAVEARVDETEELRDSDLPETYQRLSELQHERGQIESKLEAVRDEIEEKESKIETESGLRDELADVRAELERARGSIEMTERDVIEKFNEQMEDLIDILGYDNISRVWLERLAPGGNGTSEFEIHLVRESDDGTVYEDTLENLSESEREIIGIVVALSGYIVHDLDDMVPIVLFDSVESIDANRLDRLFEYINDYAPFIITALLPEEAAAIDEHTIEAPSFAGSLV